ncbi:MAG: alkaline phosphatase D family protein [Lentisphaeraceae bacterium]|nr:alkaline phosphatase D family protein [Lentisphaeraceae bacterium]
MKKYIFMVLLALSVVLLVAAKKKKSRQYKMQNRDTVSEIVMGKEKEAEEYFKEYLKKIPEDLESKYGLVLALAKQGKTEEALKYLKQSLDEGLEFSRYISGPRNMLAEIYKTDTYKELHKKHAKPIIHGPLVGATGSDFSSVWIRTDIERAVKVQVSETEDFSQIAGEGEGKTSAKDDYTAVIKVSGLKPSTKYFFRMIADGEVQKSKVTQSFKTFPSREEKAVFSITFGGGAGYNPQFERMWDTLNSHKPAAMMLLGDNVYIDTPKIVETQQYCYYRRQSRPEYNSFVGQTPVFAIYDDHDFGDDDCWGSPNKDKPAWKRPVLKVFSENWANPYYGGGAENPGCWFSTNIGDVDFFFMDCRYYRDNKVDKKPGKTMLGEYQKAELKRKLKESKATFKVICSTVPVAKGTKPGSFDTWDGYDEERQEIFNFLADNKIEGVFIISADRHRSDAWKIERTKGYPLYEFMSSRLTNVHTHPIMKHSLFGYNKKCSFGKITFDLSQEDPTATYEIYSIDNEKIHSLTLKRSQLKD